MPSGDKYKSIEPRETPCEGETFAPDGFPEKCKSTRVFALTHTNGRKLHLCEYHIECYWNIWPPFRDAIRDIWPGECPSSS